jgi:hypothetical protein
MQLAAGTDTVGLATFARYLVDIPLDQRGAPKSNLQGMLQLLKKTPQHLTELAEIVKTLLLHLIILYYIQN